MGSVVSESMGRATSRADVRNELAATSRLKGETGPAPLDTNELRQLARAIIDKEPSEIRGLLRQDPDIVHAWVSQLKIQQLQAAGKVDVWHDALDHIRLSTLSPLKFAAE